MDFRDPLLSPNAWLSEIEQLASLLDQVYAHTKGEIWLFDNDLAVLNDHSSPYRKSAFEILYNQRIDGSLASHVRCVKILLRPEVFDQFINPETNKQIVKNLLSLSPDRLDTFFVGRLDEELPQGFGGHHPWVFYLGEKHLESSNGIVIVRPHVYPFSHALDNKGHIAIAWAVSDPNLKILQFRLTRDWINKVFLDEYAQYFSSVSAQRSETGEAISFELITARTNWTIDKLWENLQQRSPPPVLPPVDCAIITALPEEHRAACKEFDLQTDVDGQTASGRLRTSDGNITIVATQCDRTGSVYAAIRSAWLIDRWRPKCLVLIGRCAGAPTTTASKNKGQTNKVEDNRQIGDVVVASEVCAYEYAALHIDEEGAIVFEHDARPILVSSWLFRLASTLCDTWEYSGPLPENWDNNLRSPKAFHGAVASGSKLLRAGVPWFTNLKTAVGKRKILAAEMEAEGVGATVQTCAQPVEFMCIKGISDFGDPNKGDGYNELASTTAASFLRELMTDTSFMRLMSGGAG